MSIVFYTDPHLGRTMQAHTTAASRQRLTDAIHTTAMDVMDLHGAKICLGDLFDKYSNSEAVIMQAAEVVSLSSLIMAGNHDVTADVNKVGSLQLLRATMPHAAGGSGPEFLITPFGKAECFLKHPAPGMQVLLIPHHTTDGLFQQSLDDAMAYAKSLDAGNKPLRLYLCLHCNYDSGFAVDETALALTRKQAKDLLDAGFDYILIGHDHHPREDWEGRVIVLGNLHPTSFGDVTAKRVLVVDDDGAHRFVCTWTPEHGGYLKFDAHQLLEQGVVEPDEGVGVWQPQFIEITGTVGPDKVLELAKAVRNLWVKYEPLAIRNKVEIEKACGEGTITHDFASLDLVILKDLEGDAELSSLFSEYWARTAPHAVEEA